MSPPKASTNSSASDSRQPLTAERVIDGALALVDEIGIDAFTIRKLADAIDVKPMTIYHHVPNKEAIIDGMVDRVFAEIDLPPVDLDWRAAMLVRCRSMRRVLANHPWASPLMESRTSPGMATLRHHDTVLGCFRTAGFSLAATGHACALLDAFLYGFALQEAMLPATGGAEMEALATDVLSAMPRAEFPHMVEFAEEYVVQPGYDFGNEFEFGLALILDGLEAAHETE